MNSERYHERILGVSKNIFFLGVASFLNDMSSEMIAPVIPAYLTAMLGLGGLIGGFIVGITASASSLFRVVFGYYSDRFGRRKPFILVGYALSTVSKALLAFSSSWFGFLALRLLDRLGKGVRTAPRDALISESSREHESGRSFGFHRMMDTLGAVVGPLITVLILRFISGIPKERIYHDIFLLSALPGTVLLIVIIFSVRDNLTDVRSSMNEKFGLEKSLKFFLTLMALGTLGRYSYAFTLWKVSLLGYSLIEGSAFYALFNLVYALSAYPVGRLSDRHSKISIISAGFLLLSSASLCFGLASNLELILLAFILYGLHMAVIDTVPRAYLGEITDRNNKGTVMGIYYTIVGLFAFPASVIAGYLWMTYSLSYSFLFSAGISFLVSLLLLKVHRPQEE